MKTYCFKLYKSKKNKVLHKKIDLASEIYNHFIFLHRRYYKVYGKYPPKYLLTKHLARLKRLPRYIHWRNLGAQASQDIIFRIDYSYKLFFSNTKARIKASPPHFKKRKKYKSFTMRQSNGYKFLDSNKLRIGKTIFKYHKSREIQGNIKILTIKRDNLGDIYIYITTDFLETKDAPRTGKIAGFDFGLKTFLTSSDGKEFHSPLFFKQHIKDVKRLDRAFSKKKKGSNNKRRAHLNKARLDKHIRNKRKDFHFKLAHELTDCYDVLIFEDLNIDGLRRRFGRKVSDLGLYSFLEILKYVAATKGKKVIFINRWEPTSKTCSACGHINEDLQLRERKWVCPSCGVEHQRDFNAAKNILRVGASTLGGGGVRPSFEKATAVDTRIP